MFTTLWSSSDLFLLLRILPTNTVSTNIILLVIVITALSIQRQPPFSPTCLLHLPHPHPLIPQKRGPLPHLHRNPLRGRISQQSIPGPPTLSLALPAAVAAATTTTTTKAADKLAQVGALGDCRVRQLVQVQLEGLHLALCIVRRRSDDREGEDLEAVVKRAEEGDLFLGRGSGWGEGEAARRVSGNGGFQ